MTATEKMNGSSRVTAATDSPWWKVRPTLSSGLAGSLAVAAVVNIVAGIGQPAWTLDSRTFEPFVGVMSATPTLMTIGLLACVPLIRHTSRRPLQVLCGLLAFAALAGAGMNLARKAYGRGPIETLIEDALASSQPTLAHQ